MNDWPNGYQYLEQLEQDVESPWAWDLELCGGESEILPTWPDAGSDHRFVHFAINGFGSEFGLWVREGQPLAEAPIAHLDSEGADNQVIARNFEEFLVLLALGEPTPWSMGSVAEDQQEALVRYREALCRDRRLTIPGVKASELADEAETLCPGFQSWLEGDRPACAEQPAPPRLARLVDFADLETFRQHLAQGVDWQAPEICEAIAQVMFKDRLPMLEALLTAGMPLELELDHGNTPLLEAATYGRVEIVRRLVAAGADPQARNYSGEGVETLIAEFAEPLRAALAQSLGLRTSS